MPRPMQPKDPEKEYSFPLTAPGKLLNEIAEIAQAEKRTVNDQIVTILERSAAARRAREG